MGQEQTLIPIDENPIKGIDDKALTVPKGMQLSLVETKMTPEQIMAIRQRTPKAFIKKLKGRGNKELSYIPVALYIRKLNFVFGYGGWSHRVIKSQIIEDHAIVEGELTILALGNAIGQFGGQPIAREIASYDKGDRSLSPWEYGKLKEQEKYGWTKKYGNYVDPGDSFKGAKSDSLKKCCSELGFFADVYAPEDFVDLEPYSAKKPPTPPLLTEGADPKTMDAIEKLIGKMKKPELLNFLDSLKPSKRYSAAQKKKIIDIADKRMKSLPDGEPVK